MEGAQRFGIKGKLDPRYIGPFTIPEKVWKSGIPIGTSAEPFSGSQCVPHVATLPLLQGPNPSSGLSSARVTTGPLL